MQYCGKKWFGLLLAVLMLVSLLPVAALAADGDVTEPVAEEVEEVVEKAEEEVDNKPDEDVEDEEALNENDDENNDEDEEEVVEDEEEVVEDAEEVVEEENDDENVAPQSEDIYLGGTVNDTHVAKIGEQGYASIEDALAAAKDGDTIVIQAGTYTLGDLSHFHFTAAEATASTGAAPKNLTIQAAENASVKMDGFYFNNRSFPEILTIKGITFDGNQATDTTIGFVGGIYSQMDVKNLTVENCQFENGAYLILAAGTSGGSNNENITIKGCTFKDVTYTDSLKATAVTIHHVNGLTVTGCTFTAPGHNAVQLSSSASGAITISNNTITGTKDRALKLNAVADNAAVTISGNTISNSADSDGEVFKVGSTGTGSSISFSGNTYNSDVWNPETITGASSGKSYTAPAVAAIGDTGYATLVDAYTAAQSGDTITLLCDTVGSGIKFEKSVTIDFGGHTYTVTDPTVGSSGTETNAFQLLKASGSVTLKNGTLGTNTDSCKILLQNYTNLTLQDMTVDGTGSSNMMYVLSNNHGDTTLTGNTNIIAPDGAVAFDVYYWPKGSYTTAPTVTVSTTGTITGKIEVTSDGSNETTGGTLTIKDGTIDGSIDKQCTAATISISGGVFSSPVESTWCAEGYIPVTLTDGSYGVAKEEADGTLDIHYETVKINVWSRESSGWDEQTQEQTNIGVFDIPDIELGVYDEDGKLVTTVTTSTVDTGDKDYPYYATLSADALKMSPDDPDATYTYTVKQVTAQKTEHGDRPIPQEAWELTAAREVVDGKITMTLTFEDTAEMGRYYGNRNDETGFFEIYNDCWTNAAFVLEKTVSVKNKGAQPGANSFDFMVVYGCYEDYEEDGVCVPTLGFTAEGGKTVYPTVRLLDDGSSACTVSLAVDGADSARGLVTFEGWERDLEALNYTEVYELGDDSDSWDQADCMYYVTFPVYGRSEDDFYILFYTGVQMEAFVVAQLDKAPAGGEDAPNGGNYENGYRGYDGKWYEIVFGAADKVSFVNTYLGAAAPAATTKPAQSPKTGDESNAALWIVLASVSMMGAAVLARKKVK